MWRGGGGDGGAGQANTFVFVWGVTVIIINDALQINQTVVAH